MGSLPSSYNTISVQETRAARISSPGIIGEVEGSTGIHAPTGWEVNDSKLWKKNSTTLTSRTYALSIFVQGFVIGNPPTAKHRIVTVDEDTSYAFGVDSFGYSDLDGDELSKLKIETLPDKGVLMLGSDNVSVGDSISREQLLNRELVYVAPSDVDRTNETTRFKFKVNDGSSDHHSGIVRDGLDSESSYDMGIVLKPVNDAPTSANGRVRTEEDSSYDFRTDDFTYADIDNDVLAGIRIVTVPGATKGELRLDGAVVSAGDRVSKSQLDDGDLSYVPPANGNGDDFASFTFKVNDGTVDSADTYTMRIDVGVVNDLPSGGSSRVTTEEDTSYTFRLGNFHYNDEESEVLRAVKIESVPESGKGELVLDGNLVSAGDSVSRAELDGGKLVYVPPENGYGITYASFTFKVNDGTADSEQTYTMGIDVVAVNDLPTSGNSRLRTEEDSSYELRTSDISYEDPDGDILSSVKILTVPVEERGELRLDGSLVRGGDSVSKAELDGGKLIYVPPSNRNGVALASFTFKVNDGREDSADTYTVLIDVTSVNDVPTASVSRVITR